MDLAIVEGYDGPQPTVYHYQVLSEEPWSPNSIQLLIGIICLAIGAAWLGGFLVFWSQSGSLSGIALKHDVSAMISANPILSQPPLPTADDARQHARAGRASSSATSVCRRPSLSPLSGRSTSAP